MKEKFPTIYKEPIETLQINIGYKCNQACKHCHVNSSPLRTEKMSNEMISLIPKIIEKYKIKTLDITGGAPELHPEFKNLITSLSTKQVDIIDRCNLTIFFEEGYEDLPQFLAKNKVIVTASLPCYEKNNVDFQRGFGVFEKSINAIKILNDLGYGKKEETRKEALRLGLRTAQKPESQDLCLVEHYGSMQRFIDKHIEPKEGEIMHVNGKVLGNHNGIQHFTVGQRKGLGISWPEPLYVKSLDRVKNIVYVAD